jgi:hypothetical protein
MKCALVIFSHAPPVEGVATPDHPEGRTGDEGTAHRLVIAHRFPGPTFAVDTELLEGVDA